MPTFDADVDIVAEYKVYMRCSGQGWEIPVQLTPQRATLQILFAAEYAQLFGHPADGMDVEITVWSVNATTPAQSVAAIPDQRSTGPIADTTKHTLFDTALGHMADATEVLRSDLSASSDIQGPAVITENETTIIVPTSRSATVLTNGCVDIAVKEGAL